MLLRHLAGESPTYPARSATLHVTPRAGLHPVPDVDAAQGRAPLRRLQTVAPLAFRDRIAATLQAQRSR